MGGLTTEYASGNNHPTPAKHQWINGNHPISQFHCGVELSSPLGIKGLNKVA